MDKFVTKRNDLLAEQVIKNLKSRQMEGHYVQTKEEALALALKLIPEGSSISWGGSMSIKAIGLPETLHKGNYKVLDRDLCATPEEKAEMMHQALNCDYFLASCNAISEDGILVNIDGNANRVAAISYGPENVLMIVGMNKIVRSAEDAYAVQSMWQLRLTDSVLKDFRVRRQVSVPTVNLRKVSAVRH